jgi:hypothetical protein
MNIHDIRNLANILMQAQPGQGLEPHKEADGIKGVIIQSTWQTIVSDVAHELRTRSKNPADGDGVVTDHYFNDRVFIDVVMGKGNYSLSNPEENDASWDVMSHEDSNGDERFYSSAVVLEVE